MYYKVLPGTETATKFDQLFVEIKSARKSISNFLSKVGAGDNYLQPSIHMAGMLGVTFDTVPSDWKAKRNSLDTKCYIPKKNSQYFEEFNSLPKVPNSRVSEILDYDMQEGPPSGKGSGHLVSLNPGLETIKGTYIISTYEWVKWRPNTDLEEITMTQLEAIKKGKS